VPALVAAASGGRESYALTIVPADQAGMHAYVAEALAEQRARRAVPFATVERATARVVGSTRFGNLEYWTWPPAFEVWRVLRVTIKTDARNVRTRAAIERLGARLDGVLRAARPGADGALRDTATYSIVDAEWPALKAALAARLR